MGAEDLYALQTDLLAAVVAGLDTLPTFDVALAGAPDMQYVNPGVPSFDCMPLVCVYPGQIQIMPTLNVADPMDAGHSAQGVHVNSLALHAVVARCEPLHVTGKTVDEAAAITRQVMADAWAVWNHVKTMIREKLLFEWCSEVVWDGANMLLPEGGAVGWLLTWRVAAPGYVSDVST